MLAARGVSLGLGKINLSELNQLPLADRAALGRINRAKKKRASMQPRIIVKKRVDRETLFVACKAVLIGGVMIALGMVMAVLGYFNRELATTIRFDPVMQAETAQIDNQRRLFFKGMQYVGPILMGFGAFAMIIACVITLESRDKHAQVIQAESNEFRKNKRDTEAEITRTSLLSPFHEVVDEDEARLEPGSSGHRPSGPFSSDENVTDVAQNVSGPPVELSVQKLLPVNVRRPKGPAPIAEADSLMDLCWTPTGSRSPQRSPQIAKK